VECAYGVVGKMLMGRILIGIYLVSKKAKGRGCGGHVK